MAVTKKTVGKKRGPKPKPPPLPQITFTEDELNAIIDYMNFMQTETSGTVPLKRMAEYNKRTKALINHIKKCEDHILEVKRVLSKPATVVND